MGAALTRKYNPNSARPRIFDRAAEAKLIALTCSPVPVVRALEFAPARGEGRRTEHRREDQRQHDRKDSRTLKKRPKAPPQSAIGDPARRQRWLRRRHGRRAGNLQDAARSRSLRPMLVQAPNDNAAARTDAGQDRGFALLADAGYFSAANVEACRQAEIEPLIAMGRQPHHPRSTRASAGRGPRRKIPRRSRPWPIG